MCTFIYVPYMRWLRESQPTSANLNLHFHTCTNNACISCLYLNYVYRNSCCTLKSLFIPLNQSSLNKQPLIHISTRQPSIHLLHTF